MSIEVGRHRPKAEIRLDGGWLGEGMRLSVVGEDKTRVEGLAKELADVLTPRHAVGVPGLYGGRVTFALGAAWLGAMTVAGVLVDLVLDIDNRVARLLLIFGSATLGGGAVWLAAWAGPTVEILEPGGRSRYLRWRGRLLTLGGTIVLGVVTSIIATVLYSGD